MTRHWLRTLDRLRFAGALTELILACAVLALVRAVRR